SSMRFAIARLPIRSSGESVEHPLVGRHPRLTGLAAVDPALQTEVLAFGCPGLDVATIDAQRRRAEKPLALRGLLGLDSTQLDLLVDAGVVEEVAHSRQEGLVVRASVEIEDLDPHGFGSV